MRRVGESEIRAQLPLCISNTHLEWVGTRYQGKVRDSYVRGAERILITTDRLSCFDVFVTEVPFKGQVLNQLALFWFQRVEDIVPNHLIASPHPNVLIGKNCEVIPIEVVVRGYLAGSAQRDYQAGRAVSGIALPLGLKPYQKLPEVLLTPSTKAAHGSHDLPISESEIVSSGIVEESLWSKVRESALKLFQRGQQEAEKQGLLLVDTKYEFGLSGGELTLVDEIHTLDSSRYWVKHSYADRLAAGEAPEMLDKEPTRQWLLSQGYKGDGVPPVFTDSHRIELAQHYISSYERITGQPFEGEVGSGMTEIEAAIRSYYKL